MKKVEQKIYKAVDLYDSDDIVRACTEATKEEMKSFAEFMATFSGWTYFKDDGLWWNGNKLEYKTTEQFIELYEQTN